eukprot:313594_1
MRTMKLRTGIASVSLIIAFYASILHFKFPIVMDAYTHAIAEIPLNTNHTSIPTFIHGMFQQWKNLFHRVIIHKQHPMDVNRFNLLLIDSRHILTDSINHSLLETLTSSQQNYSFHDLIALRRQIIIIARQFMSSPLLNTAVYDDIMQIFVQISEYYITLRTTNKHSWFHIHVSKAAGTTIRTTFHQIFQAQPYAGYLRTTQNLPCSVQYNYLRNKVIARQLQQINQSIFIPNTDPSPKNKYNYVNISAVNADKFNIHPTYIQREDPMLTAHDYYDIHVDEATYNTPSLCNKFIYILPVREPMERICSQSSQANSLKKVMSHQNLWRRYSDWKRIREEFGNDTMDHNLSDCYKQNIRINGVEYRLVTQGIDYKGYYVDLLKSELSNTMNYAPLTSEEDVMYQVKTHSYLMDDHDIHIEVPSCFNEGRLIRFTPVYWSEHVTDSEFMISTNKYMADMAWYRTKTGSNIYVSWLGYNHSNRTDDYIEFGNYVPRHVIDESHLMNAVDLMLKIDYVLPFETFTRQTEDGIGFEHSIWNITFNHIKEYYYGKHAINSKTKFEWTQSNESDGKYKIRSRDICEWMSNKDRDILSTYNELDSAFYNVSKMIEKADVDFFSLRT